MFEIYGRKNPRIYTLIVYNNDKEFDYVNKIKETYKEVLQYLTEIKTEGAWLNKQYKNKYKYYLITNGKYTIKELINNKEKEKYEI